MIPAGEAYQCCERIARAHYENFPIGWFVPRSKRRHLYAIYAFARSTDDIADEQGSAQQPRLAALEKWERWLKGEEAPESGSMESAVMTALHATLRSEQLPLGLFTDLLSAFRQDVVKSRYETREELVDYCRRSANPIGRLVLMLFGYRDDQLLRWSDDICTGIQLVNHWQDVGVDVGKDRIYLPRKDLLRHGVQESELFRGAMTDRFQNLMKDEVAWARKFFRDGAPLLKALKGRLRWQVLLMWRGPLKILEKVEAAGFDVFRDRPKISKTELLGLLLQGPRAV